MKTPPRPPLTSTSSRSKPASDAGAVSSALYAHLTLDAIEEWRQVGHHIPTWSFISYLGASGLWFFLGGVTLFRGARRPGGLRRLDILATLACVLAALAVAALGWSLR